MHSAHSIEMIERIVNLLTLLSDKRLYESAIVVDTDHRRDITLQLRHLSWSPRREIAERHFIALANDVVEFVEHLEVDVVDLLHLVLEHLWLHHRIEQHLVGTLDSCQHIHTFHQVGHTDIIVPLCLLLTGREQILMQLIVRMIGIKLDVVRIIRVWVNPDGILATFEHTAENGCQRTWPQLRIRHRQHIGHQRGVGHIPVQILCAPLRIEPTLVQVLIGLWRRDISMRRHTLLEVFPHIQDNTLVVPPVDVATLCLFKIRFPSSHCLFFEFVSYCALISFNSLSALPHESII